MARIFHRRKQPIVEAIGQLMVFLSFVGAVLYGGGWYPDGLLWQVMAKASAVSFLVLFVLVTSQTTNHLLLLLALTGSVLGDILLAIPAENSFLRGLLAFFVAHLFYVGLFLKNRLPFEDVPNIRTQISALIIAAAGVGVFLLYRGNLGSMLIPVIAYSVVLTLMTVSALYSRFPIKLVGTGAILFLISDSILGAQTFLDVNLGGSLSVWIPYYLGQLFLALGVMLYDERPTNFGGYRFD